MSRDVGLQQLQNARGVITDPLVLIFWLHSGSEERFSCSDPVALDGKNYEAVGAAVSNLVIGESAVITVPATPSRVSEVNLRTYSHQSCKLYIIPANPQEQDNFTLNQAVLALDGIISFSSFGKGTVQASVVHKNMTESKSPRINISQLANHIPPAGTVILSTKQNLELERTR